MNTTTTEMRSPLQQLHALTLGKYPMIEAVESEAPHAEATEMVMRAQSGIYSASVLLRLEGDNVTIPQWEITVMPFVRNAAQTALAELSVRCKLLGQIEGALLIVQQ